MRKLYKTLSIIFTLMLCCWQGVAWGDNQYGLKDNIQDGVILHCFDWKLSDIKAALPDIAKAGFTAVQTSPVSKGGSAGAVWYDVYRPQDYTIGNGIGSESELKDLCTTAHQYGVKVIVDVVANHTDYPNCTGYMNDQSRYHTPFDVSNWNDRNQVTHGKIGMWDNKTEDSGVQNYIHQFIEALKNCGVDGIRWDAAKHIGLPSEGDSFWQNVPDQSMYNYGEILDGTGGDDKTLFPEYQKYISITDNGYGNGFASSFNSGQVNSSIGNFNQRGAATDKLVYWGESHDTYANDGGSSKNMSQNVIDRAYAVVAGNNGATALYFSRPSSTDKNSMKLGQKGSTHFTSPEVAEVNHMHNICAGEPNYYVHKDNVAAQVRQSGAIIVLGNGSKQNVSVANGAGDGKWLKPGTYTDHVSNNTFTVTSSTISGTVGSTGIAVIYNGTPSTAANITLSPNGGTFTTETQSVTLTPNDNTSSYWYQIGSAAKQTVTGKNATTVTLGSGVDYGTSITLSWGATNADGEETTGSATYTKQDPNAAFSVYVEATTAPYIYVWYTDNDKTVEPNGAWANTKAMTASSTGWYVYTLPAGVTSYNFILTTKAGASDKEKLTGNVENVTGTVYYKVSGSSASETTDRPSGDTPTPGPTPYEPTLNSADEISVFFETSDGNVPHVWVWGASGNYTEGSFPGPEMTLDGTLATGAKVYKWTYTGTNTTLPTGIIFAKDKDNKYGGNGTFTNHGYYTTSSATASTKTITATGISTIKVDTDDYAGAAANAWYTIGGTRLSGKPAQRGMYIHKGKKVVIK